ncbi:GLPGLI family protein [Prevotella intermedia]|uniref:GLPGLI family protein n=1 Tax=Prevotella intermedia TaxID=28131 RepID=A0AAJ3RHW7_PREIN|nr:GLPGLI family protein [Prevotella intermedia]PIK17535.1 GLPGLI family protein [Prevotella intermedia]
MKRIILTSAALALTVLTVSAKPNKKDENKVIDKLKYTITYRTKSVRDTTKTDSEGHYDYENDDMQLEVGEKVSYFYSATYRAYEEELRKSVDANNIAVPTSTSTRGSISMDFYRNYPTGKSTYLDKVIREKFRITEPLEQPQWDIIADSTKQILNYDCQMARCKFKGRTWTAWFAADIPLDNGPWKLCGLPGLILRAYDSKQQYIFDCVGMKQAGEAENITYDPKFDKYATATMKEFVDYQAKAVPEDALAASGIKIEVPEEMKAELMKKLAKPMPSNPLELY